MLGLMVSVFAAGCSVGPDYAEPVIEVEASWLESGGDTLAGESWSDVAWWDQFDDPVLNRLVEMACAQNLDLKIAGLRVLEARARRGISAGAFYPQTQQLSGSYSRHRASEEVSNRLMDTRYDDFGLHADVAWELDFWGRFRRGLEAEDAALDASVFNYDAVLVSLISEVAIAYIDMRSFEQRLVHAHENLKIQQQTYALTDVLFRNGEGNELDVQQAISRMADTESLGPRLESARRSAFYRLCLLLGRNPVDLTELLVQSEGIPMPADDRVVLGFPAELVRRRPDIRVAERAAAAQSARIGVAESALYPHFSLNGSIGFGADDVKNLFSESAFTGSIGPSFRWDILNYSRIRNAVRVEDARFEQLVVHYQNTVLRAVSEVESSVAAYMMSQHTARSLAQSVSASARAVELALSQYRAGEVDFIRVLDTQSFLASQQDSLAASERDVAVNLVTLQKALGGGWQIREEQPFVDPTTRRRMAERTDWGDLLESE
ncbi:efflux transporter outer membrane subunit [Mucisphaera calidilacus]|nr:efflux transporter outer membrane subunit [Mucisphaera calidilacus]